MNSAIGLIGMLNICMALFMSIFFVIEDNEPAHKFMALMTILLLIGSTTLLFMR